MKTNNINKENPRVPRTTYATNTGAVYGKGCTLIPEMCHNIEVSDSFVYAFGVCLALKLAVSCMADYESMMFWEWAVSFLGDQRHRWRGFTLSTVPSEGIELIRESVLAFNVGVAGLGRWWEVPPT